MFAEPRAARPQRTLDLDSTGEGSAHIMSSKEIDSLNVNSPRLWFQPGRDHGEIVASVVIDGEARWLKALVRADTVTFSEVFLIDHRNSLRREAKLEFVRRAEAELPKFAHRA
jgi:hypothetical protein